MQLPIQKITAIIVLSTALIGNASATNHNTEIIQADIVNVEPIYMNYTIEKVTTPCDSGARNCWNVRYQKKAAKVLKGYRVKLSFNDNTFTARMLNKPKEDYLDIRIKSDLLVMPSTVAINAAVVY
jgi:hypothetical protein